jgi:hypothetical protein
MNLKSRHRQQRCEPMRCAQKIHSRGELAMRITFIGAGRLAQTLATAFAELAGRSPQSPVGLHSRPPPRCRAVRLQDLRQRASSGRRGGTGLHHRSARQHCPTKAFKQAAQVRVETFYCD